VSGRSLIPTRSQPRRPFILWVAIADVAHQVRPQSELDREARKRGNSTYFPDRVVPMLPDRPVGRPVFACMKTWTVPASRCGCASTATGPQDRTPIFIRAIMQLCRAQPCL
jgi:exoribonuclease II